VRTRSGRIMVSLFTTVRGRMTVWFCMTVSIGVISLTP
jgi:hypothetical protein